MSAESQLQASNSNNLKNMKSSDREDGDDGGTSKAAAIVYDVSRFSYATRQKLNKLFALTDQASASMLNELEQIMPVDNNYCLSQKNGCYICTLEIPQFMVRAVGYARAKRTAKNMAADQAVEKLRFLFSTGKQPPDVDEHELQYFGAGLPIKKKSGDSISKLNEHCLKRKLMLPMYEFQHLKDANGGFICTVIISQLGISVASSKQQTKKEAKAEAALYAYDEMLRCQS